MGSPHTRIYTLTRYRRSRKSGPPKAGVADADASENCPRKGICAQRGTGLVQRKALTGQPEAMPPLALVETHKLRMNFW
jgi:hypothetical protein